ncbi:MAG: ABC transporter permease subunit [Saprospiraceae bacterium]|nr:ABC transporter permease subunit [Saprospiraceae bacterium]
MFELRGSLSKIQNITLGVLGAIALVGLWWLLAEMLAIPALDYRAPSLDDPSLQNLNRDSLLRADSIQFANAKTVGKIYKILPTPLHVVQAYPKLLEEDNLPVHTIHSIWLNLKGYFWAILISFFIGGLIGFIPLFRGLFSRPVDAMRYLPISALTGLFMLWFGLGDNMKVAFLAFGIFVYMIPVIVQRINEVEDVHLTTVYTLGAGSWQTMLSVYFPSVISKFMEDLRVLTAISWTYIIIAEILNNTGGLGSLIYWLARRDKTDKVFAVLLLIIVIGILQDRLFVYLDKRLFPHKHYKTKVDGLKEVQTGIYIVLGTFGLSVLLPMFVQLPAALLLQGAGLIVLAAIGLILMGELKLIKGLQAV